MSLRLKYCFVHHIQNTRSMCLIRIIIIPKYPHFFVRKQNSYSFLKEAFVSEMIRQTYSFVHQQSPSAVYWPAASISHMEFRDGLSINGTRIVIHHSETVEKTTKKNVHTLFNVSSGQRWRLGAVLRSWWASDLDGCMTR